MDNVYGVPDSGETPAPQEKPTRSLIPTGKKELSFGFLILLTGICMLNSILFGGGYHLGYAIFAALGLVLTAGYLLFSGCRPSFYSILLLVLDLVILGSFARSDDGFVKFVMLCFLLLSANLSLCLMAGKQIFPTGGLSSLCDSFRAIFLLATGKLPAAIRGIADSIRRGGSAMKKAGAALLGVAVALPLLCILIPLLMRADAAFEGLLDTLPKLNAGEIIVTFLFGAVFGFWLYLRGVGLQHSQKSETNTAKVRKGVGAVTINTVLIAISLVYAVYLVSQLAYFSGAFAGILPEEYTLAEYARRGFFEMAWICGVNLLVMCLAVGLCSCKNGKTPLATRLLSLFVGLVTLFLIVSASAKMFMYIDSFGLTRLRVLTEVIMIFMGLATVTVCAWLFLPKLPYMKVILVTVLTVGAVVSWVDVDTVVARYNVTAYQSGKLETVDVGYLSELNSAAVPYLYELTQDPDPQIAGWAERLLNDSYYFGYAGQIKDFRSWNYSDAQAEPYLPKPVSDTPAPEQREADPLY